MIKIINIDNIVVGERARVDLGNLDELTDSIKRHGLIQPLSVTPTDNGKYLLLAGERRLRALLKAGISEVPVRVFANDLDELDKKTIELAENIFRKDFEAHERDALIKQIHELHIQKYGKKISTSPEAPGWSKEQTAKLLGISRPTVVAAIQRAEAREAMPEVFAACKTANEADRLLDKLAEAVLMQQVAKKLEETKAQSPLAKLIDAYIVGDFFEKVSAVPDGSVHLVEMDPPYGINLPDVKSSLLTIGYNEIPSKDYPDFMRRAFREATRVMASNAWLICWLAIEWLPMIAELATENGLTWKIAMWTKSSGQTNSPSTTLASCAEFFVYCAKGQPAIARQGRSNVFNFAPVSSNKKIHPTERPVDLMKEIYSTFTFPGSRILIPFLGSGSGLAAAHELGMNAFGFELNGEFRDKFAAKFLSDVKI